MVDIARLRESARAVCINLRRLPLSALVLATASCGAPSPQPASAPRLASTSDALATAVCPAAGAVLSALAGTLTIDAYVTRGAPGMDALSRRLEALLAGYKHAAHGHLEYRVIEARSDEDMAAAKELGIVEQRFDDRGDAGGGSKGYMGLALRYGAEKDVIPMLPLDAGNDLDFWISSKLRDLTDRVAVRKRRVGLLTGHGELSIGDPDLVPEKRDPGHKKGPTLKDIILQNFSFYELVDVDLKGGDAEVDASLAGLILTQPQRDLGDKELRRIDQFLMKGKALAVYASGVNVGAGDAGMRATLSTHGIDRLLDGYGVELRKDVVLDFGKPFTLFVSTDAGSAPVKLPQFLEVDDDPLFTGERLLIDRTSPVFFRLDGLMFPFASSLVLHKDRQPGATMRVLARSTPSSYAETGSVVDLRPFQHWKPRADKPDQFVVAAMVTGTLTSPFSPGTRQPARVFVLASSQFLANPFARAAQTTAPLQVDDNELAGVAQAYLTKQALTAMVLSFKDTLDWITASGDLLGCAPAAPGGR